MTAPVATPRSPISPEPIAWSAVVLTMLAAGVVGGGFAWVMARRWA